MISMVTNQPVWAVDGVVAASAQGFLGVNTIKLAGLPVVTKNDTRRLFGKYFIIISENYISGDLYLDQFYVQVRRPGVVALQSAKNTDCFLCIKKGTVSANVSVTRVPVYVMYCLSRSLSLCYTVCHHMCNPLSPNLLLCSIVCHHICHLICHYDTVCYHNYV